MMKFVRQVLPLKAVGSLTGRVITFSLSHSLSLSYPLSFLSFIIVRGMHCLSTWAVSAKVFWIDAHSQLINSMNFFFKKVFAAIPLFSVLWLMCFALYVADPVSKSNAVISYISISPLKLSFGNISSATTFITNVQFHRSVRVPFSKFPNGYFYKYFS